MNKVQFVTTRIGSGHAGYSIVEVDGQRHILLHPDDGFSGMLIDGHEVILVGTWHAIDWIHDVLIEKALTEDA